MLVFDTSRQKKVSEYKIKSMDLDVEHLEIPEQEYNHLIRMASGKYAHICWDFNHIEDVL